MTEQPWNVLPQPFLDTVAKVVAEERIARTLQSFCDNKTLSLRANTLKISSIDLKKELAKRKIPFTTVSWYPDAVSIAPSIDRTIITSSDLHSKGLLYIQSLSSMIPAVVLDPQPGESILDLTAAPGSKTTQVAAMMKNEGKIVANDKSRERLYKLRAVLYSQGVTNTEVVNFPGEDLWKKYPEYFDKTLVDAPCTMEGRFSCNDEKTYKDWKPKKVKVLSRLQKYLLRSAVSATKPGGLIVYSTCTLEPDENEEVVDWVLKKEKGAVSVEDIKFDHIDRQGGLTRWKNRQFDSQVAKTMRILPSGMMEGFYIAALRKHTSTVAGVI